MLLTHSPKHNLLLASLSEEDYSRLLPDLQLIPMPLGMVLRESGKSMNYVYFPTTCIVSRVYVMLSGKSAEVAITGNEGLIGFSLFTGSKSALSEAAVQSAGYGYRVPVNILRKEFALGGRFQLLLLRYAHALIAQIAQTAACNRHHKVEQQLCRLLLMSLDRLPNNQLQMTQELIANMLGVRREGVNEAARKLQDDGMIEYLHGNILVLDRAALERRVCECYAVIQHEYACLFKPFPIKLIETAASDSDCFQFSES